MQEHKSTNRVVASWRRLNNSYPQKCIPFLFLVSSLFPFCLPSRVVHHSFVLNSSTLPPSSLRVCLRRPRYEVADLDAAAVSQPQARDCDAAGSAQLRNPSFHSSHSKLRLGILCITVRIFHQFLGS